MEHPRTRVVRDESDDYLIICHPCAHGVSHDRFIVIAVLASSTFDDRKLVLWEICPSRNGYLCGIPTYAMEVERMLISDMSSWIITRASKLHVRGGPGSLWEKT